MQTTPLHHHFMTRIRRPFPLIHNKKAASYFTITFSLFCLSFFGLFAIRPTIITAISLIKSVSDLKRLKVQYENKISSIVRAQVEYEQIRDNLPFISAALPEKASFHELASALERFANRSNVSINQLQIDSVPVSKISATPALQRFGFSLIALGDYPSLSSYLQHIINWKRITTINSLEFAQEGSTVSGTLRLTLKGTSFYEP